MIGSSAGYVGDSAGGFVCSEGLLKVSSVRGSVEVSVDSSVGSVDDEPSEDSVASYSRCTTSRIHL